MASCKRLNYCGDPPPGNSQRLGGRTKPRLCQSSRLGSQRLSHSKHFPKLESTRHRPVCRRGKRKMPRLCIQFSPTSLSGECPFDKMVSDITVRLSTNSVDSHSDQQVLQDQHQNDPDSSGMAGAVVVFRPPSAIGSSTQEVNMPSRPTIQERREGVSPQSLIPTIDGMAPEVLQYGHLELPLECMNIFKEAKRPSTRKSYAFKWKRFYLWCMNNGHDPIRSQEQVILPYLLHLAKSGLQFSSIKAHLAAITAYRKSPTQVSFFKIPVLKDFLEGLRKVYPPVRAPSPLWELNIVLAKLMGAPFEPIHRASLQHLTWKVTFLVAITSARRVSEIQALCCKEPYTVFHANRVVLRTHPSFLPKVISDFHINQSITLPTFFPNPSNPPERSLHSPDLKRVLKFYLDKTKGLRKSERLSIN